MNLVDLTGCSWGSLTLQHSQEIHPSRRFTLILEINLGFTFLSKLPVWGAKEKEYLLPGNYCNWVHEN